MEEFGKALREELFAFCKIIGEGLGEALNNAIDKAFDKIGK